MLVLLYVGAVPLRQRTDAARHSSRSIRLGPQPLRRRTSMRRPHRHVDSGSGRFECRPGGLRALPVRIHLSLRGHQQSRRLRAEGIGWSRCSSRAPALVYSFLSFTVSNDPVSGHLARMGSAGTLFFLVLGLGRENLSRIHRLGSGPSEPAHVHGPRISDPDRQLPHHTRRRGRLGRSTSGSPGPGQDPRCTQNRSTPIPSSLQLIDTTKE